MLKNDTLYDLASDQYGSADPIRSLAICNLIDLCRSLSCACAPDDRLEQACSFASRFILSFGKIVCEL